MAEGGTQTYTVALTAQPGDTVTVELTSGDPGAMEVSPELLTFTTASWNSPQTVTVTGIDDADRLQEIVEVEHVASGGGYDNVAMTMTAVVEDDDAVDLSFSREFVRGRGRHGDLHGGVRWR